MKKDSYKRFDYARFYDPSLSNPDKSSVMTSVEVDMKPKDTLLSVIYAPDERTGLPTGDIQYFVSDKANPDVKQFILQNLMMDVSSVKNVTNPSGLSDDALLELSRNSNETPEQYISRLGHEIDTFKFFQEQMKMKDVSLESTESSVSVE